MMDGLIDIMMVGNEWGVFILCIFLRVAVAVEGYRFVV